MRWSWNTRTLKTLATTAAAIMAIALTSPAFGADEPTAPTEPSAPASNKPAAAAATSDLSHKYQFGVAVRMGSGYRVIAPYQEEDCGELDDQGNKKSVCGGMYPLWLEVSPSFGITSTLEVLVDIRIPLDKPSFTNSKGFFVAPGIKYFTDPESAFKFFLTAQIVFESQSQSGNAGLASFDFGVRSALGVQIDLVRYVGLYAQAGLIFGFNRWMSFLIDFGGGLQVRY